MRTKIKNTLMIVALLCLIISSSVSSSYCYGQPYEAGMIFKHVPVLWIVIGGIGITLWIVTAIMDKLHGE